MLFIASVYAIVIAVLLVSGPFMFELGPLRVQASTFRKPVQIVTLTLILAVALSPGVRTVARQSRVIGFYVLAAIVTWALALGPMTTFMGSPGIPGPYHLLMSLPGVDSLRVPARFWLMTTICLSVVAGLVVAEFMRGRSRRVSAIAVILVGDRYLERRLDRSDSGRRICRPRCQARQGWRGRRCSRPLPTWCSATFRPCSGPCRVAGEP